MFRGNVLATSKTTEVSFFPESFPEIHGFAQSRSPFSNLSWSKRIRHFLRSCCACNEDEASDFKGQRKETFSSTKNTNHLDMTNCPEGGLPFFHTKTLYLMGKHSTSDNTLQAHSAMGGKTKDPTLFTSPKALLSLACLVSCRLC